MSNYSIINYYSLFSSDIVQLLDDKTIYIPNFFLTVGNTRGYKFKVKINYLSFVDLILYVA